MTSAFRLILRARPAYGEQEKWREGTRALRLISTELLELLELNSSNVAALHKNPTNLGTAFFRFNNYAPGNGLMLNAEAGLKVRKRVNDALRGVKNNINKPEVYFGTKR